MGLLRLLIENPVLFAAVAVMLLYSIIAHEVAHGLTALFFGDDTAKRYGRLTFNPLPHIDPIGALMLFIVGFGWAKPVPVDYSALGGSRIAVIAVALAGCLINIFIAFIAIFLSQLASAAGQPVPASMLAIVARINVILGAFNLIPIPPLDGSKVLMSFLPWRAQASLAQIEPYGFFILIILIFTGMLDPVLRAMMNAIYGLAGRLLGFFG